MLIESYIEKDILIKTELINSLYQGETIGVSSASQLFQLSSATLIDYIEEICERLKPYVLAKNYYCGEYKIVLATHLPVYVYQKLIFKESRFLQGVLLYLQECTHYLEFVEKLYISVGSSYSLKRKVEQAFNQLGLRFEEIDELGYRLLCMNISLKVTPVFSMEKNKGFQKWLNYFFTVMIEKGFILSPENKYYVSMGFLTAYNRREHCVQYTKKRKKMLEQLEMFQCLKEFYTFSDLENYLPIDELYFLTIILNSCHYTFATINRFNEHYTQLNNVFIYGKRGSIELVERFSGQFKAEVKENQFFINAVTKLLKTAYLNEQLLFPSQSVHLNEKEIATYQKINYVLGSLSKETTTKYTFNENYVKRFTKEVIFLLDQNEKVTSAFVILTNKLYNSLIMSIFQEKKEYLNIPTKLFNSYKELDQVDERIVKNAIIFYDDILEAPTIPVKSAIPINVKTICGRFS